MIKQLRLKVKTIRQIKPDVFLLSFSSTYLAQTVSPGQFLHLKISSVILRRPFSVHKLEDGKVYILFKVKGRGTKELSKIKKGNILDIIGPLGRGFNFRGQGPGARDQKNILVAGGMGVAPLLFLAQELKRVQGQWFRGQGLVLLGAKNKNEILGEKEFKKLGFKVYLATDNGSRGYKGTVVNLLRKILLDTSDKILGTIYACGPQEMFFELQRILKKYPKISCQVSFEQFMGCGLGICCACVIQTKQGYQKVCKDGPVFDLKEVY